MTDKSVILVVDDTPMVRTVLSEILSAEGYQVRAASSGELALASIAAGPPDLILLDLQMADMDGFEVLRQLKARKESCDIPIIFISGASEIKERVEGLKLGAVDFITKPFQSEELLARVRTHLLLGNVLSQLRSEVAERKRAEKEREKLILELKEALANVKQLNRMLPICASCKKIRDDKGYWSGVESYISEHTEAVFSHGICPDCEKKAYEELEKLNII
jgi:DNA-binding response OmpR family regulator